MFSYVALFGTTKIAALLVPAVSFSLLFLFILVYNG